MKAIIILDGIPDWQIGQEVSIYFPDTMSVKGIVEEVEDRDILYNEEILGNFLSMVGEKVKRLTNLDTINGLLGAIPMLREALGIEEDEE